MKSNKKRQYSKLSKRILNRFFLSLLILLAVMMGGYFLAWFICKQFIWYDYSPFYSLFKTLQMLSPVIEELAQEFDGKVLVGKVNVDEEPELARRFGVMTIPTVVFLKNGKEVERKVFPGYVLIKMVMTDDTWHLVRNVRGVTGFVGTANKPIPLTEEEVLAMGMEKHEIVVGYNVGDHVRIVDGPLASFTGVVEDIEPEKNQVSVMVSMFGRETPVELELDQVEVLN